VSGLTEEQISLPRPRIKGVGEEDVLRVCGVKGKKDGLLDALPSHQILRRRILCSALC